MEIHSIISSPFPARWKALHRKIHLGNSRDGNYNLIFLYWKIGGLYYRPNSIGLIVHCFSSNRTMRMIVVAFTRGDRPYLLFISPLSFYAWLQHYEQPMRRRDVLTRVRSEF